MKNTLSRRRFVGTLAAAGAVRSWADRGRSPEDAIARWNRETEAVSPAVYEQYLRDGETRGYAALENLEKGFEKVMAEVKGTTVGAVPAVWSVYNMGYVVKTQSTLFAIDLVHRRGDELAQMVDFTLVTHNHRDHWRSSFVSAVAARGKPVFSNFLSYDGYTRAKKIFRINEVEVRTSLIDHNRRLIDFTTPFEIRVGGSWTLYHTGDSGEGTEPKLETVWGPPDLWLFFPGCGINTPQAVAKVRAKRIVFGHLWELAHEQNHRGRLDERLIRPRLAEAKAAGCRDVSLAYWGDRIC
jgi:L-ascorbate metabolism protein UlaG (beta-lactamase superfamily)